MHFDQHNHHYFGFLKNTSMGALYLTISLVSFASGLINVFVPIYLWQLGFAFWEILFFFFLFSLYTSVLSIALIPLLRFSSDKLLIFVSIPAQILYFLGLDFLNGMGVLFFLLPLALALRQLLFNLGYNLGFATAADDGDVGKESGISILAQSISPMAAPVLGGFLIALFGFDSSFLIGSIILFLAMVPLLVIPNRKLSKHLKYKEIISYLKNPEIKNFNLSEIALAIDPRTEGVIWALFIFLVIGSIESLGEILSIGLLAGAIVSYLAGAAVDRGYQKRVMQISTWGVALMWFLRPFFAVPAVVVSNHVIRKIFRSSMLTTWSAEFYDIARHLQHMTLFLLSKEFFLNLVRAIYTGLLVLIAFYLEDLEVMKLAFISAGAFTLFALYANLQKDVGEIKS